MGQNRMQKNQKDIIYHEMIRRLTRRSAVISHILGIETSSTSGETINPELVSFLEDMNDGLSFDFKNLINAINKLDAWITSLSGDQQIPLSNTVWVNLDLTENDIENRIFKSWLDAKDWILANTDYSENNLWQIMLPAGNVGNITLYEGIRLGVTDGTVIENLSSSVTYNNYNSVIKAYLAGAIINNLDLGGEGKCCALYNCVVNNVIPATSTVIYLANDCQFLSGDFENYNGSQLKCTYSPLLGDINNLSLTCSFNELTLIDGYAFELNCIDIDAQSSGINVTSISGELYIENCTCDDLLLSSKAKITNSTMGSITGTKEANITVKNSNVGDIILEDTAILTHENSTIGTATVAAGATLTRISEPYDNTISGLTATNVKDAIDELKASIDELKASIDELKALIDNLII